LSFFISGMKRAPFTVGAPAPEIGGALQRVERAVDLDRGEETAREFELAPLRQALGIEDAAPAAIAPARDADADHFASRPFNGGCRRTASALDSFVSYMYIGTIRWTFLPAPYRRDRVSKEDPANPL
jgi:hypothetical protein